MTEWGYGPDDGPEVWADLDEAFRICRTGRAQSPIDLTDCCGAELGRVSVDYAPTRLRLVNDGHTIMALCDPGSDFVVGDARYELVQFHFHTPSEHTVDGSLLDGEVHLVHATPDGAFAVIGVFLEEGDRNPALHDVVRTAATLPSEPIDIGAVFDPTLLLPDDPAYYRYDGSLTTPPGTEGVLWTVFRSPVPASAEQLGVLREVLHHNVRPVQPINERQVYFVEP